jgi:dynein heavy chain
VNSREQLFEVELTDYEMIPTMTKKFAPYGDLWIKSACWLDWNDTWMNGPLQNLDFEAVQNDFEAARKVMKKAVRTFKDSAPGCADIAKQVGGEMEAFSDATQGLALVEGLRNQGMKERHWDELSEKVGKDVHPDENFTLKMAIDMGLGDAKTCEIVTSVADVAQKQFIIENQLKDMDDQWAAVDLIAAEYKATGTYVVKGVDEVNQLLDDHIVLVQAMSFSPFKGPFEEAIADKEFKLCMLQDVIGEWLMLQRQWMYLEPIFASDDINRQLPQEGKKIRDHQ